MRDVKKRISKNVSIATSKITIAFETVETFYNNMLNGKTLTIVVDLWQVSIQTRDNCWLKGLSNMGYFTCRHQYLSSYLR